jgi:hypothetical protein
MPAINDRSVDAPLDVNSQTKPPQFTKTVTQKMDRKDSFLDL